MTLSLFTSSEPMAFTSSEPMAVFGPELRPDGEAVYRYSLTRRFVDPDGYLRGRVLFVMVNPSTADAEKPDRTITRCIKFARDWGFARLDVVNLFGMRTPYMRELRAAAKAGADIVGPENDAWIERRAQEARCRRRGFGAHEDQVDTDPLLKSPSKCNSAALTRKVTTQSRIVAYRPRRRR